MERASREDAVVYWGDETGVSNCETVERGFAPKGRPPVLPVETKRERVNMLSAISREGHVRFMVYQDAMNQGRLIQFMQRLIRTSERKVFLVLDNLKVHHGKLVKAWLEKKKAQIEVFFLPPYAPAPKWQGLPQFSTLRYAWDPVSGRASPDAGSSAPSASYIPTASVRSRPYGIVS